MAKHDQRILKFLNQNADRAPTITEMMTRLNISISDISASLSSLLAQGLIAKKTNSQGIECWFPSSGAAVADVREKNPPPPPSSPAPESASAISAQTQVLVERPPLERPVERLAERRVETSPEQPSPEPAALGAAAPAGAMAYGAQAQPPFQPMMSLAPPAKGIGFLTLLFGMAVAVGASLYVGNRLVQKTIDASILKASKGLVDQKAFGEAINSWADFEARMQTQNKALETQVQALKDTLAAMRSADSLLVAGGDTKKKSEPAKVTRRRAAR